MIYTYKCPHEHIFDVVKRLADHGREEKCPECGEIGERYITKTPGFTTSESLGYKKAPRDFRNFLNVIHKNTPGSKMEVD